MTETKIPLAASLYIPDPIEWCPQVTVTPEDNNRTVFNNGILYGSNTSTPKGGNTIPIILSPQYIV